MSGLQLSALRAMPQAVRGAEECPASDIDSIRLEVFYRFDQAEATWRAAESSCFCHIFQTFDWLAAWHETIGTAENVTPCIVHVTDSHGNTLMLLPLGIHRRNGLAFLSFLGGVVSDYHAPLIGPGLVGPISAGFVTELLARVRAAIPRVDVVAFERMPGSLGIGRNPFADLDGVKHVWSAHLARVPTSFEEFRKTRKSKLFTDTERRRRLLNQLGETRIELATTPEATAAIFDAFVRQKSRRWLATRARDLFASPGYLAFYRMLAERSAQGPGHLSALWVGSTIVATHLGAVFRGRFYYLMPSHAAGDWGRFSVGRQLLKYLVEWSIAAKLTEFDFTVGDEAFKAEWAELSIPLYDYMRGVTVRGRVYCLWIGARERLKMRAKRIAWLHLLVKRLRNAPRPDVAAGKERADP